MDMLYIYVYCIIDSLSKTRLLRMIMASLMRGLNVETTLVLFLMIYLVLSHYRVEGGRSISRQEEEDEDVELERQLKLLNKPVMKSIKTEYGDIFDCVDIKKQPAFDHPLLRNHTIQMKPSSLPKGIINEESVEIKPSETGFKNDGCPPGTVIIRRTRKEDLIWAKSQVRRNPRNAHQLAANNPGYHFATAMLKISPDIQYYGALVHLSIYQPKVSANQFSEAVLWVENGPVNQLNSIQVGWTVNPRLFRDSRSRLFSYWTADGFHKTGCYNLLCTGFVQVSRAITFGVTFTNVSTDEGKLFEQGFLVFKDQKSGNWWFKYENEHIGYWPSTIFTTLKSFSTRISVGGEVHSPTNEPSPPMGSGHLPHAFNRRSAAYARRLQFVDARNQLVDLRYELPLYMDNQSCYQVLRAFPWGLDDWKTSYLFGGPGGACGI